MVPEKPFTEGSLKIQLVFQRKGESTEEVLQRDVTREPGFGSLKNLLVVITLFIISQTRTKNSMTLMSRDEFLLNIIWKILEEARNGSSVSVCVLQSKRLQWFYNSWIKVEQNSLASVMTFWKVPQPPMLQQVLKIKTSVFRSNHLPRMQLILFKRRVILYYMDVQSVFRAECKSLYTSKLLFCRQHILSLFLIWI